MGEAPTPVVVKLRRRSLPILAQAADRALGEHEAALSPNAVTGYSVNVPIALTCEPSKVCLRTCYAASNHLSTPAAIARQGRVLESLHTAPVAFAARVASEALHHGIDFVRWNGVGDLDESAVEAINAFGAAEPTIAVWVVSRIASLAANIEYHPSVYVHFSTDRESLPRLADFRAKAPLAQWFASYQCDKGENLSPERVEELRSLGVAVIFTHRYGGAVEARESCPLNGAEDCVGMCAKCRRCFDGTAVAWAAEGVGRAR